MTDPIGEAVSPAAFSLTLTDQERQDSCRHTIRRLSLARKAMQQALRSAGTAAQDASLQQLSPAQLLAEWQASTLVMESVFNSLDWKVSDTIVLLEMLMSAR
jgi:hypothetical protein